MGITDTLQPIQPIYLDTNVFIYLLEMYPKFVPVLTDLFSFIDSGHLPAVTSELTLAETLVKPMMDNNLGLQNIYQTILKTSDILQVVPVSRQVLLEAAKLRATSRLKLPDAIHLATALTNHCQALITNDSLLKNFTDIRIVLLSDFVINETY